MEDLLDARIDHVAVIDFDGFQAATNALRGVTVTNERAFASSVLPGTTFPRGELTLSGEEALAFVRERRAFASGDFQRVKNQQVFLSGLAKKMFDTNLVTDAQRESSLFEAISPYFARNEALTADLMIGIGGSLRGVTFDDLGFFTLPSLGTETRGGGAVCGGC